VPTSLRSPAVRASLGLVLGLAVGVAISASASQPLHSIAAALEPIGTAWVNAIRMTVIPLVVSLLIATIAEESDLGAVGRLGGRAVALFATILAGLSVLTFLAAPPIFALLQIDPASAASLRGTGAAAAAAPALPTFANWLVGLVPPNPVKAAVDGTMLPLIIFAVAFAAALARTAPERRAATSAIFRGIADAMLRIVGWVLAVAPIGVFCLALALAVHIGAGVAGAVGFYLVVHCAFLIVAVVLLYVMVAIFSRVPFGRFTRAMLPAQVVAMTTRSSMAALPAMIDGAGAGLGLSMQVAGFSLPFGVSVFRVNQAVSWIVTALFVGKLYGIHLTTAQLAFLGAACVPMSFSVPGIPSGGLFMIAPFFMTVGLPIEGVGILIALDAVPDIFKTLLNVTAQFAATVLLARSAPADSQP
jgi:proton glutamate symport protein